jgi:hypothetical protein
MTYRVPLLALLLAVSFASPLIATDADDKAKCEAVASIGLATLTPDGVITLQIRSLPPGPIAEGLIRYAPGDAKYVAIKQHLGGIAPGETKPVRPLC